MLFAILDTLDHYSIQDIRTFADSILHGRQVERGDV